MTLSLSNKCIGDDFGVWRERVIFMTTAAVRGVVLGPLCWCEKGSGRLSLGISNARPWCRPAVGEAIRGSCELDKVKVPGHRATARAYRPASRKAAPVRPSQRQKVPPASLSAQHRLPVTVSGCAESHLVSGLWGYSRGGRVGPAKDRALPSLKKAQLP